MTPLITSATNMLPAGFNQTVCQMDLGQAHALLRDRLYPHASRPRVIPQEYISNAVDEHLESGATRPIEITLPTQDHPTLVIRDFGRGVACGRMGEVFFFLGRSTKTSDERALGGYGIGAKSAFALSDSFTVTTTHAGKTTTFIASVREDGYSAYTELPSVPATEPTGIEVTIPIAADLVDKICVWVQWLVAVITWYHTGRVSFVGRHAGGEFTPLVGLKFYADAVSEAEAEAGSEFAWVPDTAQRPENFRAYLAVGGVPYQMASIRMSKDLGRTLIVRCTAAECRIPPTRDAIDWTDDQRTVLEARCQQAIETTRDRIEHQLAGPVTAEFDSVARCSVALGYTLQQKTPNRWPRAELFHQLGQGYHTASCRLSYKGAASHWFRDEATDGFGVMVNQSDFMRNDMVRNWKKLLPLFETTPQIVFVQKQEEADHILAIHPTAKLLTEADSPKVTKEQRAKLPLTRASRFSIIQRDNEYANPVYTVAEIERYQVLVVPHAKHIFWAYRVTARLIGNAGIIVSDRYKIPAHVKPVVCLTKPPTCAADLPPEWPHRDDLVAVEAFCGTKGRWNAQDGTGTALAGTTRCLSTRDDEEYRVATPAPVKEAWDKACAELAAKKPGGLAHAIARAALRPKDRGRELCAGYLYQVFAPEDLTDALRIIGACVIKKLPAVYRPAIQQYLIEGTANASQH